MRRFLLDRLQAPLAGNGGISYVGTGGSGGGGGGVTAVTATAPITSSGGASPNIAGNVWDWDNEGVPAAAVRPALTQKQSTTGVGQTMVMGPTQAPKTGSGANGGDISLLFGNSDGGFPTSGLGPFAWIGVSTGPGTNERTATDYFNYAIFKWLGGGVMNLVLGGGSNNGGAGLAAVEVSTFVPLNIATENNSPISFAPSNGVGQCGIALLADANQGPAIKLGGFGAAFPPALGGIIRLPWETSSTAQELVDQRNATNTGDLSLMSRQQGVMTWGSKAEPQNVWGQVIITYDCEGSGTGHAFVGPNGPVATLAIDGLKTWVQADTFPTLFDSWSAQVFHADTNNETANQTIATIPLSPGTLTYALTHLKVTIEGLDESTGDFATFSHRWAYTLSGGVLTAPTGAQPAAVDDGHSAGAGTAIAPQFAISGTNILVQVTPWAESGIHWTVRAEKLLNAGQKPAPTVPPGSPVFWFDSGLQGLGAVPSLTDQSGSGHNMPIQVGTARSIVAGIGPGGTLPALLFNASAIYGIASALGLGTTNFTMACTVQVTSTTGSGQQAIIDNGQANLNGTVLGVDMDASSGARSVLQGDGSSSNYVSDGAATTAWEAWIFSSDAAGNLTFYVNGVAQPLSPSNQVATAPAANTSIGGNPFGTYQLVGALYDVILYDTIEDATAIHAYQHAKTGL